MAANVILLEATLGQIYRRIRKTAGADGRTRTDNLSLTRRLRYQLRHTSIFWSASRLNYQNSILASLL